MAFKPFLALLLLLTASAASANEVRVRDLGRFMGQRDNALVGYGIVTGLAGSGDSPAQRSHPPGAEERALAGSAQTSFRSNCRAATSQR